MRELASIVAFALLAGCGASIQSSQDVNDAPLADSWETLSGPIGRAEDCSPVEPPLIYPVSPQLRPQSIDMLSDVSVVALTDLEVARLIDASSEEGTPFAQTQVSNYLDEMRARKHRAVVERRDSWSLADENELVALSAKYASGDHRAYQPYLVRAVAKHEATGSFYANLCGDDLQVHHGSLGRSTPPSIRAPLVVYLGKRPERVSVTWEIAE